MNAFTNRRDITMERENGGIGAPGHPGVTDSLLAALLKATDEQNKIIRSQADISETGVLDREPAQFVMANFPFRGSTRYLLRRTGDGGIISLPTVNVPVLVCEAQESRLGLFIGNAGTNPIALYLTSDLLGAGGSLLTVGVPVIYLPVGAQWNGKLADVAWLGNVNAVPLTGAGSIAIAVV